MENTWSGYGVRGPGMWKESYYCFKFYHFNSLLTFLIFIISLLFLFHFFHIFFTLRLPHSAFSEQPNKNTQVTDAPCKRKPLHGTLALEWFSFSQNVQFTFLIENRVSHRDAELISLQFLESNKISTPHFCEKSS